MKTPQTGPDGTNSHRSTTIIMIGLCTLCVFGSIVGFLNMVKL